MVSVVDIIQGFVLWLPSLVFPHMVSVVAGNIFYGFRRWLFDGFHRGRKTFFIVSVAGCSMDSAVAGGFIILEVSSDSSFCFFLGLVSVAGFLWFPSWQENVVLWFPSLAF